MDQVLGAVEEADGFGLGQRGAEIAEGVLDAGLKESVPVAAEPCGSAMGFVEILHAASTAEALQQAMGDVAITGTDFIHF